MSTGLTIAVAGVIGAVVGLLVYAAFYIAIDQRERRMERQHRQAMADSAIRLHRMRQDAGRYLTDEAGRPE